ncbi:MAG: bacteriocin-protection protein [Frankiales bacterium]|nr:bacteriocin-protection protein [Frankiales bacterium]
MRFFATPDDWRAWLQEHHARETELVVGFHKRSTGKPCMTWSESVDEALCFGWIDAIRRRVDDETYTIRFTRRKPSSIWSAVNVAKVESLEQQGKMTDAGRAAFARRREDRTGVYSFEQGDIAFDDAPLRAVPEAWAFWERQPPSYQKVVRHWLASAKRPETREKRLKELIDDCVAGLRIKSQRY